jgi:hypothetical protein
MQIIFPTGWVRARLFEEVLAQYNPAKAVGAEVELLFPQHCALLIDTALKVLSLANQLDAKGCTVTLNFKSDALWGYLDRMGFFGALSNSIIVLPGRPVVSLHDIHFGENPGLMEIGVLTPGKVVHAKKLPGILADRITRIIKSSTDDFGAELFTVFSELVGNYFEHSESALPGYVVAQTYHRANGERRVLVAISDSGLGITHTIRRDRSRDFARMVDADLLLQVFNEGVSRHGKQVGRGCGLNRCSDISLKYQADLIVRTPGIQAHLRPGRAAYEKNMAAFLTDLGEIGGTHLSFEFRLDKN